MQGTQMMSFTSALKFRVVAHDEDIPQKWNSYPEYKSIPTFGRCAGNVSGMAVQLPLLFLFITPLRCWASAFSRRLLYNSSTRIASSRFDLLSFLHSESGLTCPASESDYRGYPKTALRN